MLLTLLRPLDMYNGVRYPLQRRLRHVELISTVFMYQVGLAQSPQVREEG
ncbi:hypothetical protein [Rhizobium sp. Leaf383]|nr:hypothetical protein [Rhizobium sp. Leaf383]